jgi:hypothetical protein
MSPYQPSPAKVITIPKVLYSSRVEFEVYMTVVPSRVDNLSIKTDPDIQSQEPS